MKAHVLLFLWDFSSKWMQKLRTTGTGQRTVTHRTGESDFIWPFSPAWISVHQMTSSSKETEEFEPHYVQKFFSVLIWVHLNFFIGQHTPDGWGRVDENQYLAPILQMLNGGLRRSSPSSSLLLFWVWPIPNLSLCHHVLSLDLCEIQSRDLN